MEVNVGLSKSQRKRLLEYVRNPVDEFKITLSPKQLKGEDKLYLHKGVIKQFIKHQKDQTPFEFTVNKRVANLNRKMYGGAFLSEAQAIIKPVQAIASKLLTPDNEARLNKKLAKLRGKGVNDETIANLRDGFLYGIKNPKDGLELAYQLVSHFGDDVDEEEKNAQIDAHIARTGRRTVKSGQTVPNTANSDAYMKKFE